MQVCNDPTTKLCNIGQGNMHSPLFSAALQNMLTAQTGSSHCFRTGLRRAEPVPEFRTTHWHYAELMGHLCSG